MDNLSYTILHVDDTNVMITSTKYIDLQKSKPNPSTHF